MMGQAHGFHSSRKLFDDLLLLLLNLLLRNMRGSKCSVVFHQPFDQLHDDEVGFCLRIKEGTSLQIARRFGEEVRVAFIKSVDGVTVFSFVDYGLAGPRMAPVFPQISQRPHLFFGLKGRQ
jgi:hypothetical protein